jgi:TonB family protein
VNETSGFEALDQAAANVATVMRFTPAQNRDQTVAVWVQVPIRFQVIN